MTGRRIVAIGLGTALVSSAILGAISPGGAGSGAAARAQKTDPSSDPPSVTTLVSTTVVPGTRTPYRWPAHGEAAVAVRGIGVIAKSPLERPVPIASLTKMMTALVILKDHPLGPLARGPLLTVSPTDVTDYANDLALGDSTLKIALGEHLDEHQLLEALLLPSGDNIADLLARWDAGNLAAFVVRMNAEVRALGLTRTHYTDASGVSPGSVSTAADQSVVESALMSYPAAREVVRMRQARLPIAGQIPNYNPAIGIDGIVGVKSGWTTEAGACLATAAYRDVDGHGVLVESVSLGQPGDLHAPALVDESLLDYATRLLEPYRLFSSVAPIQLLKAGALATFSTASQSTWVVAWPGLVLKNEITTTMNLAEFIGDSARIGTVIGHYEILAPWGVLSATPATLASITRTVTTTTNSTTTSIVPPTS
ncbi:MAG: hypothetical protein WB770_03160 [Acidimicrobiales bacterium]